MCIGKSPGKPWTASEFEDFERNLRENSRIADELEKKLKSFLTDASLAADVIQRVNELMSENTRLKETLAFAVWHLQTALEVEENYGFDNRVVRVAGYAAAIQSAKVLLKGGE